MIRKKLLTCTICILLGASMLTGCGIKDMIAQRIGQEEKPEEVTEEVTEPESEPEPEKPEEDIADLIESKTGQGFKTNDADAVTEEAAGVEDLYGDVLSEVRELLKAGELDYDTTYKYVSTGIQERVMYPEDDYLPRKIGYLFTDLNGDGTPELLIGENDGFEYDDTNPVSYVFSGFTIKDDKPYCFLEGWARNRYHYMGDGKFYHSGSSGAMNSCFGQCHLGSDGELVWDDFFFSKEDMIKGGIAFFENTTGTEEPADSVRVDMDEDRFWELAQSFKCIEVSWIPMEGNPGGAITDGRELSNGELSGFEHKLSEVGYYGFLLSTYEEPTSIYWHEVFYVGAGFDQGYPSDDVLKAYLKQTGEKELMTDLTTISGKDVENYVKETTGYDYSEMKYPLDWIYLKDYDLYAYEHGDTNQFKISLISGMVSDDVYTLTYDTWDGVTYCVTFSYVGNHIHFISNLPEWFILDPTNGGDIDQSTLTDGQLIPDSDIRYLTEADLEGFDAAELRIARNEIYARHGRKFNDAQLQEYFNGMDWYAGTVEASEFNESVLNDYEIKNLDLISKYEKKIK